VTVRPTPPNAAFFSMSASEFAATVEADSRFSILRSMVVAPDNHAPPPPTGEVAFVMAAEPLQFCDVPVLRLSGSEGFGVMVPVV
jgi:hypothetical protein